MAEPSGVEVLQSEIEKAKDKLRGYNEHIKKLTGRDPSRPGIRRLLTEEGTERGENDYPNRAARGRGRIFGMARYNPMEDSGPPAKRRAVGGAFSRLGPMPARRRDREDSPYEEELPNKLSVHSSVVSTSREAKNRQEIMQEQTKDKEGMQRNRRMFGLLLGTLNKFKTESKTMATKEYQRKRIEEKLEENAEKEKRKFKQETKLLIEEMHLEQSKISRLQQKMEMVDEHAEVIGEVKKLKNFIVTRTKPRIFWKPQLMNAALENKLKESRKVVDGMLQESNNRLEKEIKELMERENKREERIKMRLREDGLLEDGDGKGEVGDDEGNKIEGMGDAGRVVEVKEEIDEESQMTERLGRDFEEQRLDVEMEELGDPRKKSRRTVVIEREVSSGSESEMEQESLEVDRSGDQDMEQPGLGKEMEVIESAAQPSIDESGAGKKGGKDDLYSDDLYSEDRHTDSKELGSNMSEGESSDIERELQPPREPQRNIDKGESSDSDREPQLPREPQRTIDKGESSDNEREPQPPRERQRNIDKGESSDSDREPQLPREPQKNKGESSDNEREPQPPREPQRSKDKGESSDSDREPRAHREHLRNKDKSESSDSDRGPQPTRERQRNKGKDVNSDSERQAPRERQRNKDRGENSDRQPQVPRERQRNKKDRGHSSDSERESQTTRERQRNKDRDGHRNKDRSHKESKKDKRRDEKDESEERSMNRRRRSDDKRHSKRDSGDKGRVRKDNHEDKRDKERRRESHDSTKKSSSHRSKDRKRYSDSEESDVEIKQEVKVSKNKDASHSESSNRDRDTVQKRSKVLDVAVEID